MTDEPAKPTSTDPDGEYHIFVDSMVAGRDQQPYVVLWWEGPRLDNRVQMTPHKAREVALMLLEIAESTDQDGFFMEFIQTQLEQPLETAAGMLAEFRVWRAKRIEKGLS